jgi:hypothetical protein
MEILGAQASDWSKRLLQKECFFFSSESSTTRGMTTECTSGVRRDAAAAVLT